ncbi:MAG: DNA mismatch repair protein MutS [Candidatus Kapabacteria bacterium]|nr:DNA mismatch repair protein MutS [Candidatus Kapabacteria bacterium]
MEKDTPLTRQYNQIKQKYPDTVLLFRLGDFFETFNEDAKITAKVCGITLTKRNNGAAGEMPLAGFPQHQLDNYLPKLVRAGYRVAVCEQLEDPKKAKGLVKRDVVEVVTPGVALYDKILDHKLNNYICSVYLKQKGLFYNVGLSFADISTGEYSVSEFPLSKLIDVIESIHPAEIIISKAQKNEINSYLEKLSYNIAVTKFEPWIFDYEFAKEALLGHFKTNTLKGFGIEYLTTGIAAAGAILYYIKETQNGKLDQLTKISLYNPSDYMLLDYATRKNLEITYSLYDDNKQGTLISILDKTKTSIGGRKLKKWITYPLLRLNEIRKRLEYVRTLVNLNELRLNLQNCLSQIADLERLSSKICNQKANPRDLIALKNSLKLIPQIKELILNENNSLKELIDKLIPLDQVVNSIENAIVDEPSVQLGTGNVFRRNYHIELDSYIEAKHSGKKWISNFQEEEKKKTGIPSLKVGYNNVFGYYIDITNTHKDKVPQHYERKQTLTNSERYVTKELKEIEQKMMDADEKISEIESNLFTELLMKIALFTDDIQNNADIIATIDCLQSYAQSAIENKYCEPQIDNSDIIEIIDGRHPVVEKLLPLGQSFTPNSTYLNPEKELIHIITGPNMSGKSCYLRQTALIILMGQIGSFVPAKSAKFGLVDRIFTRVGAQDNITAGESTFLVEMQEAANIINNATEKSLILLDEVGRGTATFDGISIAWSITEYIHNVIRAKTLFATHYHELNELKNRYENIANYHVEVIETEGKIIFSHKVKPGGSNHSFGIHVAQMAGLPETIIKRANELLVILEESSNSNDNNQLKSIKKANVDEIDTKKQKRVPEQLAIFEIRDDFLREKLRSLDINHITPVEALHILSDLINYAKKESKN